MNRLKNPPSRYLGALALAAVLALATTGCVTAVTQLQTGTTLAPKQTRLAIGGSVPISTRYVSEIVDTIDAATARLSDAEAAGQPITAEEQRQAIEGVAAILLLQPTFVTEAALRVGVVERVDVGLRWAGSALRLDGKWQITDDDTKRGHIAATASYTHHTSVGSNIATSVFDVFESINLVSFSRRDLELSLLASTAEQNQSLVLYGGLRYLLSLPRIESELADGVETESGVTLIDTDANMHNLGVTTGIRLGPSGFALMLEMTVMYQQFTPTILDEERDLGGLVFSPGVGIALEI